MTVAPKVSVLVPVFNAGQYLPECLDSILAQNFSDFELLIADDGSTDDSLSIIKQYAAKDARIRWWRNLRNRGLTANSNVCLREAKADYIKFVHQDDKLLSVATIQKMLSPLEANPKVSLVGCRQHVTGSVSQPTLFSPCSGCFGGRQMIVDCLERNTNLIGQPTLVMFRRAQAQRGFDERFTGFMDFEMWCHLLEQGDFAYIDEPLATWRAHHNHQTARSRRINPDDDEHRQFMEIYFAKPWLNAAVTDRLLFTQIYYLRKKYGRNANGVTQAMMKNLTPPRYAWHWAKHKISQPLKRLRRKLNRQ